MVVNLQMTKEHLTHKHWSHIVPGIENFLGMGDKKFLGPGSSEWVTRNSWEKLSTFSQDFPVKDSWEFPRIPRKDSWEFTLQGLNYVAPFLWFITSCQWIFWVLFIVKRTLVACCKPPISMQMVYLMLESGSQARR